MTKTIGFIGLGVMGQGMVRNLLKAGFSVKGYNRTKEKGMPLEQDGAVIVDTIQEAVTDVDVVISIVGYPQDVEQIYLAEDGILASANPGTIVIDMTTSSPALAIRIAEQAAQNGLSALDAPVTGGDLGAKTGPSRFSPVATKKHLTRFNRYLKQWENRLPASAVRDKDNRPSSPIRSRLPDR